MIKTPKNQYLCESARLTSRNRSGRRRREALFVEAAGDGSSGGTESASAESVALNNARLATVRTAMNALGSRQREVMVLRFVADLSVDEVAATLQISRNAVSGATSRAIKILRERIGEDL